MCVHDGEDLVDTDRDPWVGRPLDRYRIEERLGTGGMGCVYRARHTVLDREYAIKVLFADFGQDERFLARFKREAQSMGRVRHENIVHVEDFGTTPDGTSFLVMELVGGRTLERVIAEEAPFSAARAALITRQIAAGLGAAHEGGFVHRDVKPSNAMVFGAGADERVKLLDFGAVSLRSLPRNERLTHVGHIIGTPTYMAPEQSQDPNVGPTADLYALGVVLFEMLTGHPPFGGEGRAEILVQHITSPPPAAPPSDGLERLVGWLLEKRPESRPQSTEQVLAFLDQVGGDLEATAITNIADHAPPAEVLTAPTPMDPTPMDVTPVEVPALDAPTPPTHAAEPPKEDLRSLYRDLTGGAASPASLDSFPALGADLDWANWSEPGLAPLPPLPAPREESTDEGLGRHAATQVVRDRVHSLPEHDQTEPADLYPALPSALAPPGESDDGGPTQVDFDLEEDLGAPQPTAPARAITQTRPPIEHLGPALEDPATLLEEDDPAPLANFDLSASPDTVPPPALSHEPWLGEPSSRSAPPLVVPAPPDAPRSRTLYFVAIGGLTLLIGVLAFVLWTGQRTIDLGPGAEPGTPVQSP